MTIIRKMSVKLIFCMTIIIFRMTIIRHFSSKMGLNWLFSSVLGLKMDFGMHIIRKNIFSIIYCCKATLNFSYITIV